MQSDTANQSAAQEAGNKHLFDLADYYGRKAARARARHDESLASHYDRQFVAMLTSETPENQAKAREIHRQSYRMENGI